MQSLKKIDADPFLYAAIEKALQRVMLQRKPHVPSIDRKLENVKPELDERLQWIIEPLQRLLQTPDTARNILQQLKILENRFYKLYRSPEATWGPFNTDTSFFEQIQWIDVFEFANALSRKDQDFFSQYVVNALDAKDDHARRILNTRWNDLSIAVEECMVAKVDVSPKIDHLAQVVLTLCPIDIWSDRELQELYRVRNYYSLTAIIQGIKASGFKTKALGDFGYLVDSKNNYEMYRWRARTRPGMDFLFPALSTTARGNFELAAKVIDRHAIYKVENWQHHWFFYLFTACFGRWRILLFLFFTCKSNLFLLCCFKVFGQMNYLSVLSSPILLIKDFLHHDFNLNVIVRDKNARAGINAEKIDQEQRGMETSSHLDFKP